MKMPQLPWPDPLGFTPVQPTPEMGEPQICAACAMNSQDGVDVAKARMCLATPCMPSMRVDGRRVYFMEAAQ